MPKIDNSSYFKKCRDNDNKNFEDYCQRTTLLSFSYFFTPQHHHPSFSCNTRCDVIKQFTTLRCLELFQVGTVNRNNIQKIQMLINKVAVKLLHILANAVLRVLQGVTEKLQSFHITLLLIFFI